MSATGYEAIYQATDHDLDGRYPTACFPILAFQVNDGPPVLVVMNKDGALVELKHASIGGTFVGTRPVGGAVERRRA